MVNKIPQSIQVKIEYRILGEDYSRHVNLASVEYFDLNEAEEITIDCIPKYDHAIDYLDLEPHQIQSTVLRLSDNQNTRLITEFFFDDGNSRVIERTDFTDQESYAETILDILLKDSPLTYMVIRLDKTKGILQPNYYGIIKRNSDGTEEETLMYEKKQ